MGGSLSPVVKNHYINSASELLEHFIKVVLPLADTHTVPKDATVKLPGFPKLSKLGSQVDDYFKWAKQLSNVDISF